MRGFERRNQHFAQLVNTPDLCRFGQNTNHFQTHDAVREAMIRCNLDEKFHIYAPPVGLEEFCALLSKTVEVARGMNKTCCFSNGAIRVTSQTMERRN